VERVGVLQQQSHSCRAQTQQARENTGATAKVAHGKQKQARDDERILHQRSVVMQPSGPEVRGTVHARNRRERASAT